MAKNDLTDRQKQILKIICTTIRDKGFPPSVREIGDVIGLKSSSSVHAHLRALEKKGYIRRDTASARAIMLNENMIDDDILGIPDEDVIEDEEARVYEDIVPLPLVGRVAAGTPILAEQNIEETIGLPKEIVGDNSSFLLTVSGESMIEAGILDGDIVVVREQHTANNGDIVVAMIDDSATVKTFYKEADCIRLQPQNPTMDPIYVKDVTILGKVTALFRTI